MTSLLTKCSKIIYSAEYEDGEVIEFDNTNGVSNCNKNGSNLIAIYVRLEEEE